MSVKVELDDDFLHFVGRLFVSRCIINLFRIEKEKINV